MRITVIATGFSGKITAPRPEQNPLKDTPVNNGGDSPRGLKRRPIGHLLSIEETDLQPATQEEDIFTVPGVPKTQYDIPAVLRRNQLRGRRQ